jgi:RimJ/RimL family protein N-acetyltransferase
VTPGGVASLAQLLPGGGIDGKRVLLRPFGAADITHEYVGWLNDPAVVRYSNQRFRRHDRASCERYLASFDGGASLFLSVRLRGDDVGIGTMTAYYSPPHGTVDVGIMIGAASARGLGLGRESWVALTGWLLELPIVRKLTAGTLACNAPMLALMKAAGLELEAVRRRQEIVEGRPEDVLYFCRFGHA